jgi:hypothetical protein
MLCSAPEAFGINCLSTIISTIRGMNISTSVPFDALHLQNRLEICSDSSKNLQDAKCSLPSRSLSVPSAEEKRKMPDMPVLSTSVKLLLFT